MSMIWPTAFPSAGGVEDDHALDGALLEELVGGGRLGQREDPVDGGCELPVAQAASEEVQGAADQVRAAVKEGKEEADQPLSAGHQPPWRERLAGAASRADQNVPAEGGERVEVLLEDTAADSLEEEVGTASPGERQDLVGPPWLVVADRGVRSQAQDVPAPFWCAGRADDRVRAQGLADLHGQAADTAGRAVNEQRLAAAQRGGGLQGQVGSQALARDAGQAGAVSALIHGHGQVLASEGVLGVGAFLHGRDDWL